MRTVICAGKTGGHVFPALAVARLLRQKNKDAKITFFSTRSGLDRKDLTKEGFSFFAIFGRGLPPRFSMGTLWWAGCLLISLFQVLAAFIRVRPQLVLAFGGYISAAPILIAGLLRIPVVIHEGNASPGRANRFLARWARFICTSFPIDEDCRHAFNELLRDRIEVTGLPIREDFFNLDKGRCLRQLELDPDRKLILVMGGSLGSKCVNDLVLGALDELGDLVSRVQFFHVTGRQEYERIVSKYRMNGVRYKAHDFFDHIELVFGCADLFIGRAGASTLAEITYCGVASILIPYPYAIEDHQTMNASYLAKHGAAFILEELQVTPRLLAQEIAKVIQNDRLRLSMSENALRFGVADGASRIVDILGKALK